MFEEFGETLAEFLIPVLKRHNISVLILGGNISNAFDHFSDKLTTKLRSQMNISIVPSTLGEHAALMGAASYRISQNLEVE